MREAWTLGGVGVAPFAAERSAGHLVAGASRSDPAASSYRHRHRSKPDLPARLHPHLASPDVGRAGGLMERAVVV